VIAGDEQFDRFMIDEAAYRAAFLAASYSNYVFEEALAICCATCKLASRHALAERESMSCASPVARTNCATFLGLLRERAAFSLRLSKTEAPFPHAIRTKLQRGGLVGLRHALLAMNPDAHQLVAWAQRRWGSLLDLPWPAIVRSVVSWEEWRRSPARE
jgi:hypothetical protein